MPWRSRSARRSSTSADLLAGTTVVAVVVGAAGWAVDVGWLAGAGLAAAILLAGASAARLVALAHAREAERVRLTEQLITAEQDERRRLSVFLHDGPLSSMSGIALMHDAALAALADGRVDDAARVIETSLEREREIIRSLRDLTFAMEPLVLRDHGFSAAVDALLEQIERAHRITVSASVTAAESIGEKAQVALYQIVREAVTQAVRRRPGRIEVGVTQQGDGSLVVELTDDGVAERRRASIEAIEERVHILNGRLTIETEQGGTIVRVVVPAYVATPAG